MIEIRLALLYLFSALFKERKQIIRYREIDTDRKEETKKKTRRHDFPSSDGYIYTNR